MIVRRCLTLTISIYLILSVEFGAAQAERWSRQVSNSEWIPLANPRASQSQLEQNNQAAGLLSNGNAQLPQLPSLSLPPALQQQYQDQLLQLQKTQENIQKLLLLQQQLRTQQQLLQSQGFLPSGFSNSEEDKQLHQSGLRNAQSVPEVASEDLLPPLPPSEALPPVFPPQNFLPQRPRAHPPTKQDGNVPQEFANLPGQEFKTGHLLQHGQNVEDIEENQRQGAKHLKDTNQTPFVPSENAQDEEDEVQLVYVPAETLAQRGQKRVRGRKQYPPRQQQQHQHQHRENQGVDSGPIAGEQDAYARQVLQQIQMEREENAQFLKEERMRELARLNEEQKALERKNRLQQEAVQREQELQRQREAEKKRKELEKLEEIAKQRELDRIREAREKQRLEELERRRLAEVRAREEKRRAEEAARQREAERLAALERQKQFEMEQALKQQQILEKQREDQARATSPTLTDNQEAQALPLIRDQQFHRQHLTETSKPVKTKTRGRQRQRQHQHQYQEQQNYREATTTPSPNQPPLSVYMGGSHSKTAGTKVSDVLKILKDAKTIAVLDTVGPDTPQVFVGPTNLDPPNGYAKFDLPYLSSIDHNRVERKVDKLPFFVAPLSFDPPPGYSKIPFPAPHIGSVVVNTLDNTDPKEGDDQRPNPTPLIEPNSYIDGFDGVPVSTTPLYEPQTTIGYSQEPSSTPKYEQTYSTASPTGYSGSRFRFRQFYGDNKPASVISTSYYDDQRPTTRKHKYYDESPRTTESPRESPKLETLVSHVEEVSYSTTPSFNDGPIGPQDSSTKSQDLAAQLALINEELAQQREAQRYKTGGQYGQQGSSSTTGLSNGFDGDISAGDVNDVRTPIGPTQYNLPAELPAISPHLPGLVNSLLDKNEAKLHASTTPATTTTVGTTTTTTTQRTPTTTYRPRGRQRNRVVPTRSRTTTPATSTKTNVDRNRRPYNRSRSRFTTTTEEYRDTYEPTKSRIPETTLRYNEHRRTSSRTKYRNREKPSQQTDVLSQSQNSQSQQAYENIQQGDSGSSPTGNAFLQPTAPETTHRQLDPSPGFNDFANYPSTTVTTTENYPSVSVNRGTPLVADDYSRTQHYSQNLPEDQRYRGAYDQEQTGLEKTPVNGFNYQLQDQGIVQRPKDYQLDGKAENSDFELATTADPRPRTQEEQRYSSVYDPNVPQTQPEYSLTGQDGFSRLESEKIQTGIVDANESPIFVPLPENKQEDYDLPVSSTEAPLADLTTETTTTSTTPVVIRQRVRGRVGTRVHHDPSIQTRTRGSQDEYVRFNVVNHDASRTSSSRQRNRPRTRTQNQGSQVQMDGNEYIKIHAVQQKQVVTTTSTPPTVATVRPTEEDVDYGFIRPPNFRPVYPVDNRFPAPVTFRTPLPEVPQQSLLANDETAVESSPPHTQVLKNRQKYQPTPNRRLSGKATTLPPATTETAPEIATTTERIPVATLLPDDAIYTVKPKSRPDESKQTRIRGRIRRPGKKRASTTTTTESVLESHNELPLDENYPRIPPQPATTEQQQNPFDDTFDGASQFASPRDPTAQQYYETSSENYPSEFILNFGNYPDQGVQREEYDQTQLASSAPGKYESVRARPTSDGAHSTTSDIYGAESQWSTKLTRTSFQPSFAVNRLPGEPAKDREWYRGSSKDVPEIITAAPAPSSVTLVVSSDDKGNGEALDEESMLMGTTIFGRKTSAPDHTEKINATGSVTGAPATIIRGRNGSRAETTHEADSWLMDRVENSTEQQTVIDFEKTLKKTAAPPAVRKGTRRRKVRVRVRPAVDDFVTAESQHFNSAINGLFRDQYKYDPLRESKLPPPGVAESLPQKSILEDFLTEILKTDRPSTTTTTTTTTETPEAAWTMSPAVTTPMIVPDDAGETTTETQATTIPTTEKPEETTTVRSSFDDFVSQFESREENEKSWNEERTGQKETREHSRWKSEKTNDLGYFADRYATRENDVGKSSDDAETVPSESSLGRTRLKPVDGEDGTEDSRKQSVSGSFEQNEESRDEDNYAHPKNHRAKWSEVRYAFERSQASAWNYEPRTSTASTTSIPGLVTRNEGDASVKTLSDYVQAIFDSMKSAEEETTAGNTERPEETMTTVQPEAEFEASGVREEKKSTTEVTDVEPTTRPNVEEDERRRTTTTTTESTTSFDPETATTLEPTTTTSETVTSSSTEPLATDLPQTTTPKTSSTAVDGNTTESILGKVLRTSTTTRVSHMTEICYRGRCVMTRPSRDDRYR